MKITVEYIPNSVEAQLVVGYYHDKPIIWYGTYRTVLEDGFVCLSPHNGMPATLSCLEWDVTDEYERGILISEARRVRKRMQ